MKNPDSEPCPGEMSGTESRFGAVQNSEFLIRFVTERKDIVNPAAGVWKIAPASFAEQDINGVGKGENRRSVSTFRDAVTSQSELVARATKRTADEKWKQDPVIGVTVASNIREIVDQSGRRNFCIFADKTENDDPFGVSDGHASIRKSNPANPRHQRQEKAILRSQLSDAFYEVRHLISGSRDIIM